MQSFNTHSVEKSYSPKTPSPKDLSNEALIRKTQTLVAEERKLTTEILWHLHEIQSRRLYAEKGYASLFEYAVQALGYSEASAGRRIAAMRLLADVPEIEPALKKGEISLTTLSTIQNFIQRKHQQSKAEQGSGASLSKSEKRDLVFSLQGKSKRECEKVLIELDPLAALPKERERVVSPTQTEIRFVADDALMQKLQMIKDLDGHVQSSPSYLELFHRMADLCLKHLDPLSKKPTQITPPAEPKIQTDPARVLQNTGSVQPQSRTQPELQPVNPRYIPAALKREIWSREQGQCAYQSSDGKRCTSRHALELDHIVPLAWGGKSEPSNLQLLCREHNRLKAVTQLGASVMGRYMHA